MRNVALALILGLTTACAGLQETSLPTEPPVDTEASLIETALAIHQASLVLDAHADIVLPSTSLAYLGADGLSKVEPAKLGDGGMGAVVMSIAVGPGPRTPEGDMAARAEADEKLAAITALADTSPTMTIATSLGDVIALNESGQTAVILGFQNARSLQGDISALDTFYQAGVRVFGLNHMGHNDFSDSSRPLYNGETRAYEVTEEHGGLSDLGVAAIRRINALGAVVDVSQMSKAATMQAIRLSQTPVIASHSNVRKLSDVSRNLSDEEIDLIGETGGVIHVAAFGAYMVDLSSPDMLSAIIDVRVMAGLPEAYSYPYELYWELETTAEKQAFVSAMRAVIGPGSVERLIDHIDYVVARIGIDHVGIGSDFNHGGGIDGFRDASEALNITIGLVRRGYSEEDIAKIWGGNFMRVFRQAESHGLERAGFADLEGQYQVIGVRSASFVASIAPPELAPEDSPIGKTIGFDRTGLIIEGMDCERWVAEAVSVPADMLNDPMLRDLRLASLGDENSDGDARLSRAYDLSCEGEHFALAYQTGPRTMALTWDNSSAYLILEAPLTAPQISMFQAELKSMKFYAGEATGVLDEATLEGARWYYAYRLRDDEAAIPGRVALTANLLDGLGVLGN